MFNSVDPGPNHFVAKDKDLVDKSLIAVCPFNRSHMLKKSRLQYHIVSCMKHYKGQKVPCPYNHSEYFEPAELLLHLQDCKSRMGIEVNQFNSARTLLNSASSRNPSAPKLAPAPFHTERFSDENWGLE